MSDVYGGMIQSLISSIAHSIVDSSIFFIVLFIVSYQKHNCDDKGQILYIVLKINPEVVQSLSSENDCCSLHWVNFLKSILNFLHALVPERLPLSVSLDLVW